MKFNRNLAIFAILLAVSCLMLVSQVSAVDFDGKSLSDLDNSIKTSDDGNIVLTDDLSFNNKGTIEIDRPVTIDGRGHSINISSAQNDVLFDVKSDTTFKNLVLSGGNLGSSQDYLSIIMVSSSSVLTLENVTIKNANLGHSSGNSYIYNSGTVIMDNTTFTNMGGTMGSIFYGGVPYASVNFENSCYKDSTVGFSFGFGDYYINNSSILDINSPSPELFYIFGRLYADSSLFKNIKCPKFSTFAIDAEGAITNNVFLDISSTIIDEDFTLYSSVENNYFGTNTPVEDGLISSKYQDNIITLNISLPDNDDINNLTVGKKTPVEFKLIGDTKLLPKFTVNLTNVLGEAELSQNSITFDGDSAIIYITPREKGNGSVVLGYDLKKPIKPSFDYAAYGDLKNYTLVINSKDSITHGDDLDVVIELKDDDSNPVSGDVSLFVNGKFYENVNVANGIGSIKLSNLNAPDALLSAFYYHDLPNYNDADVDKSITVQKRDLDLKYSDVRITEGEVATVVVSNIPDDLTSSLVISLSNEGGQVHQSNGVATQSFSGLGVGNYKVSIFTLGDNNYNMFDDVAMIYVTSGSSTPDTPDDPVNPDDPVDPDVPVNPDNPVDPDAPVDSDTPDYPDTPGDNPGGSEPSDSSDVPDTPSNPDVPDTPDTPVNPDTPVTPDDPVNPDTPVTPDTPSNPDVPDSPDVPDTPDTPVNPDTPVTPDSPSTPDDPVNPDVPDSPDAPDVPDVPDAPDVPSVPDAPDVPDVPDAPDVPSVPDSGDIDIPPESDPTPKDNSNPSDSDSQQNNNQPSNSDINSDSINSNSDNAQSVDATTGTTNDAVVSSENSAPSSETQSENPSSQGGQSDNPSGVAKSYDINEVIDNVIHSQFTIPSIAVIIAVLLLLIFGYRRKKDDSEEEY